MAAKSSAAAGEVSRCFREREADKLYAALVFGHREWDERKIKAPIAVSQRRFKQRVAASGKSAETHAFVGARGTLRVQPHIGRDASLLWLAPKTGRRHQLRLHLSTLPQDEAQPKAAAAPGPLRVGRFAEHHPMYPEMDGLGGDEMDEGE